MNIFITNFDQLLPVIIENVTVDPKEVQYDCIESDVGEHKETQNDEISEPYYSEIVHNVSSDSGYTMKPNISYSTLQVTNAMSIPS